MITSLRRLRQQLFCQPKSILGVAFHPKNITLAEIQRRGRHLQLKMHTIRSEIPFTLKDLEKILCKEGEKKYIVVSLPVEKVIVMQCEPPLNKTSALLHWAKRLSTEKEDALLQSAFTTCVDFPAYLFKGDKKWIDAICALCASLRHELIAIDWQPLAIGRVLKIIVHAVLTLPTLRFFLLACFSKWDLEKCEAFGAALNGLAYVEY